MIHILLPVHNRREITRKFISCLLLQTVTDWHLILIDDGSSDDTAGMVLSRIPSATVIRGTGDWWWAGSLQKGYEWLAEHGIPENDLVLIMNDDTTFEDSFLADGCRVLDGNPSAILGACNVHRETGLIIDTGITVDWKGFRFHQASSPEEINCLSTRGLMVRMGDFKKTGGFRPHLLPHYGSDYEFTIRANRHGLSLMTDQAFSLFAETGTAPSKFIYQGSAIKSIQHTLTNRTARNPFMWSILLVLCCPFRHLPINLFRIWLQWLHTLLIIIRLTFNHYTIKKAVSSGLIRLVIGSSVTSFKGWVSTDRDILDISLRDQWERLFPPNSIDAILSEHVWEHLTPEDAAKAAGCCHEFLKPGGYLRLAVPDGLHPSQQYIDAVRPGGNGYGSDDHKVLYDYRTLSALLERAGFSVKLMEYFDEEGAFHAVDWNPADGMIRRSARFDSRNSGKMLQYTSLIVDAVKMRVTAAGQKGSC